VLRAIRGFVKPTLREIEVIGVVDGPEPGTFEALASIGDARLRVKALPTHVGASGARNAGDGETRSWAPSRMGSRGMCPG
jgi:hypothetical protein